MAKRYDKDKWKEKKQAQGREMAEKIITAFQSGNLPKALSQAFIDRGGFNCDTWSYSNKILMALANTQLAMGFKQWLAAGRCVKKGTSSFYIWKPIPRPDGDKKNADGSQKMRIFFGVVAVHRIEDTEIVDDAKWAKRAAKMVEADNKLNSLPFKQVADAWGIKVSAYSGKGSHAAGWYCPGENSIGMGVENPATFAHELCHSSDDRLGNLKERGQHWRSETVAELGGAALLFAAGYETDADLGGAFDYLRKYSAIAGLDVIAACKDVIERTGKAVQAIIDAAVELDVCEAQELNAVA